MRNLIFVLTILAPASALAGGYVIPNENARDLALAEASVADQTGPEAIFLNTAALAGPEGLAISASGELLVNRTTWSDPAPSPLCGPMQHSSAASVFHTAWIASFTR